MIFGKEGQVGWELQRTLAPLGHLFAFNRQELDLQCPESICKIIREIKPDLIVNAAAYTAVDKAEIDFEDAHAINALAPEIIAEEAKKCHSLFVHYSTDYVFDGASQSPYKEDDMTNPLNVYGKTKLQGELAIQAISGKYLILRTSWVYAERGKNFLLTMLRLGNEKPLLRVVSDQLGAPTWSHSIAFSTAQVIERALKMESQGNIWGIYHLTAAGHTSWHGFAQEIFDRVKSGGKDMSQLEKIEASEYPLPAKRPLYSLLSNQKLLETFEVSLPNWKDGLHLCMDNIGLIR